MGKWLAAGAVGLIALLVLLWMQIREPAAAVSAAPQPPGYAPARWPACAPAPVLPAS